ncbi:MAG: sigma-70 family RNA polymerase sigma factor [Planctomycetes bacterium]|nr:sigma-70 family RNA polymerase sigma factor [Planctomycetota bacterium]
MLLERVHEGDGEAGERLLHLIYDELRRLARARLAREWRGRSIVATELVHECYLRLFESGSQWENRAHFFGSAAEAMRRILVERARAARRLKRGGDRDRVPLADEQLVELAPPSLGSEPPGDDEFLALDTAIGELEAQDERLARVVKLRYFAGLTVADTARALDLTERTVHRDWAAARAWLHRRLAGSVGLEP